VNDSTGFETENSLDLEMAGSLAPGASLYNFYFSGALTQNPATWSNVPGYLADDLGAALSFDYGPRHLAVVSCSFGLNDLNNSLWDTELAAAAATGVTVVVASGDQGDAPNPLTGRGDNPWPLWPASAAFNTSGAISVGGVTLALSGQPTSTYTHPPLTVQYDPNVEGIANASAWWDTSAGAGNYAGTEGGASIEYPEPWWQFHSAADPAIVRATQIEGTGHLGRAGPDVAFPGNSTIAFVSAAANGSIYFTILEGTSIASPVFAGILADVVAVENASSGHVSGLGFLDPELYRIGSYYAANPGGSDPFLDVVYGSNAMFSAGPGWDATTGWGGLCAPLFLAALENSTVTNYTYAGPTPTLPPPSGPRTPPLTIVIVFAAVAGTVLAVTVLFVTRSRRRLPPLVSPYPPGSGVYPPGLVGPPTGMVATFSCPYCGRERPAEPGHCPSCGAM
jgi:subtilase family serine protease